MRLVLSCLLAVGCASSLHTYKPRLARDEGAAVGRVRVVYNGTDLTQQCAVCFRTVDGPCFSLDTGGFVAISMKAGAATIRRIACNVEGERHYHFKGFRFEIPAGAKTYFGDVTVDWTNQQGFKPSQLFGLAGAIVDQSINDGQAALSVADARADSWAWYAHLFPGDTLPARESLVTYVASTPMLAAAACAPLAPALVADGATLHAGPDEESTVMRVFPVESSVCAGGSHIGFGFTRVKTAEGVQGFVLDSEMSR